MESEHKAHTLKRVLVNGRKTSTFMCTNPRCGFREDASYLVGKMVVCPYCNLEFIATRLKLKKQGMIHCDACSKFKRVKASIPEEVEKLLEGTA